MKYEDGRIDYDDDGPGLFSQLDRPWGPFGQIEEGGPKEIHHGGVFMICGCSGNLFFGGIIGLLLVFNHWTGWNLIRIIYLVIYLLCIQIPIIGIFASIMELQNKRFKLFFIFGILNVLFGIFTILGCMFSGIGLYYAWGYRKEYMIGRNYEARGDTRNALIVYRKLKATKDIERITNYQIDERLKIGDIIGAYKICQDNELIERGKELRRMANWTPEQISAAYRRSHKSSEESIDLNKFKTAKGNNAQVTRPRFCPVCGAGMSDGYCPSCKYK